MFVFEERLEQENMFLKTGQLNEEDLRRESEPADKINKPPEKPLWEQMENEPDNRYNAFRIFLDFGPKRSYRRVAQNIGKVKRTIYNWSKAYNWLERADAFDRAQYLEVKSLIMEQNARAISDNYRANLYLSKRAVQIIPALIPFLEMFYKVYDRPDAHEKLKYLILVSKAIKEVRSLINFSPGLNTNQQYHNEAELAYFIEHIKKIAPDPEEISKEFSPDYIQESQYRENFTNTLREPRYRKDFYDIDDEIARRLK